MKKGCVICDARSKRLIILVFTHVMIERRMSDDKEDRFRAWQAMGAAMHGGIVGGVVLGNARIGFAHLNGVSGL
jgi:hypothetical protein